MSKGECPRLVVALFTFKGKNNDELCFKKGDIITITQTDDGGWWEGTLHDMTGWFPSNYVKDYKISDIPHTLTKSSPEKVGLDLLTQQKANRSVIIKDIIDSEQANVAELQGLINNFLQPLETANILRRDEYKQLIGNMHDVLNVHQHLLSSLEASLVQDSDIRTGNLFLTIANKIKSVHMLYCSSHAQAVCILDRFRDELNEFMERNGAVSPGILVLTTGLSKPFRRLEKYSTLLQELERHMEPNHPDRGDTQRSVSVYRDIADKCSTMRKQKELALTVLAGGIKGWEGENLHTLGDIIYVGPVILLTGMDHRDRYLVLFSTTLLVLSTSQRMSSFIYEGKLPLTAITVTRLDNLEDTMQGFEISGLTVIGCSKSILMIQKFQKLFPKRLRGPMIEKITVLCPNRHECEQWMEYLSQDRSANLTKSPTSAHASPHQNGIQLRLLVEHSHPQENETRWSLAFLRPAPPMYSSKNVCKGSDLLDSNNSTRTGTMLEGEPLPKTCNRISISNNKFGNWQLNENRNLAETVDMLKNQISDLQSRMIVLTKQLDDERNSRLSLAAVVKRSIAVTDSSTALE